MSKAKPNPLETLPQEDRLLITTVVNALNDEDLSKAESRIFIKETRRGPRSREKIPPGEFSPEILKLMLSEEDQAIAKAQWQSVWESERYDFRQAIRHLARHKRLTDDDAEWLKYIVDLGVTVTPKVDISKGRAKVSFPVSFDNPEAAIAYVLLRLSAFGTRIFACKECGRVVLPESRVGSPNTGFCSKRHRWRFTKQKKRNEKALAKVREERRLAKAKHK